MKMILLVLLGIALLICLLMIALSATSRHTTVGLLEGRLRPCPQKPNCVCSEDKDSTGWVEPLTFHGSPARAWERLVAVIADMGGRIQQQDEQYIWATFTTRVFRFVDDVEFRMVPEEGIVHLRSASRVGHSDLGVNGRRVEELRSRFSQAFAESSPNHLGTEG